MNKVRTNLIGTLVLVILAVIGFNYIQMTNNTTTKINSPKLSPGAPGFNKGKHDGKRRKEYLVIFFVTGNRKTGRNVEITWSAGNKEVTEQWIIGGNGNKTWRKSILVAEGSKLSLIVQNIDTPGYTDCRILVNGKERVRDYAFDWDTCKVYSTVVP